MPSPPHRQSDSLAKNSPVLVLVPVSHTIRASFRLLNLPFPARKITHNYRQSHTISYLHQEQLRFSLKLTICPSLICRIAAITIRYRQTGEIHLLRWRREELTGIAILNHVIRRSSSQGPKAIPWGGNEPFSLFSPVFMIFELHRSWYLAWHDLAP